MLGSCVTLGKNFQANLPNAPADLRTTVPQPEISEGENALSALAKSRVATKEANNKITRWNKFYEKVKKDYGQKGLSTTKKRILK